MGGCASSLLSTRNYYSTTDHEGIVKSKYLYEHPVNHPLPGVPAEEGFSRPYVEQFINSDEQLRKIQTDAYNTCLLHRMRDLCKQRSTDLAVGYRPVDHIEKSTIKDASGKEKKWEFTVYRPTVKISYNEFWSQIVSAGQGYKKCGVKPGDRVGIYEDTRLEWIVGCYGLWTIGAIPVTVYANLGLDALQYAVAEAGLSHVVCNASLLENIQEVCRRAEIPTPTFIYIGERKAGAEDTDTILSFTSLLENGKKEIEALESPPGIQAPSPDDIALIMYTSGTTGNPKGVIMSHGNVNASVTFLGNRLELFMSPGETSSYLAFLPLAHILEFAAENVMLLRGVFVGYGNPRTITDTAAKPHGDLREFRPFMIAGVPRVYDTIKKTIEGKVPPGMKKAIFDRALADRLDLIKQGKDTPYFNSSVFGAVKEVLGGQCKAMVSGGAPLSGKTQEFIMNISNATLVQGYGLTETCSATTTQYPWDLIPESLGAVLNGVELRLKSTGVWSVTSESPAGEILVRGPAVSKGYYHQEEKTKEAYTDDGWFYTGDVGEIDGKTGALKIVGRVKALAKTAHGEYIALETLESIYVQNPLVIPNGICLLVDSNKPYVAGVALADEEKVMKFASENKLSGSFPDILSTAAFQGAAAKSLADTAKSAGRKPFEFIKHVRFVVDEWTPENGVLTAAQKLKRGEIDKRYADLIKDVFSKDE